MRDDDSALPDPILVERAMEGDDRSLEVLLVRHQEVAYRVALGIVHDPERAADAVQDALLKAFRGLASFRGDAQFRTWLLSIVVNEARGSLRRTGRRRETALDDVATLADDGRTPDEETVSRAEARRARAHLAELPEKQRLAVQLRVDEGLSFREVGEIIGSSEGAARVNYHHGIRRLRDRMESES